MPEKGWTIETYAAHNEALREADAKFQSERDRRYSEVKIAESKALELQAEKDQKHFVDLNHEQARLLADRERYLPRETYAADRKDKAALWLAICSLVTAVLTLIAVLPKWAP
jgi:hypothetical protein